MRHLFRSAGPVQKLAVLAEQSEQPECLERGGTEMPRHQSRPAFSFEEIERIKKEKKWWLDAK